MPGTYPTLSFSSAFKYPVRRNANRRGAIATFCDFSEQRWNRSVSGNLYEFELHYSKITTADKETLRTFYAQQQGEFATDWSLVFDGMLYRTCQFIGPFSPRNVGPNTWNLMLKCRSLPMVNGGAPEALPHGLPVSATLFILTSHIPATGVGLYTGAMCSIDGFSLFSRGWLSGGGAWTLRTDSKGVSASSVFNLEAMFAIGTAESGTSNPPCQFLVYDCWLNVTYADGTAGIMRPTGARINFTWTDGVITNPQNAIDGNQTDCATITRTHFDTLDFSPVLILSNFA